MKNILRTCFLGLFIFFGTVSAQDNCDCTTFTKEIKKKFGAASVGGKYEEARLIIQEQIKSSNPCCQAIGYVMESIICNAEGKTKAGYENALKSQELLKGKYNAFASIESNRLLGIYYNKKGNADSSVLFYFKSLEMAKKEKDNYTIAKIDANISSVFLNQKQYQKGLEFTKKSLEAAALTGDTIALAQSYANLVTVYGDMYENSENKLYLDSSMQFAGIALLYAKASKIPLNIIRCYLSMEKFSLVQKDYPQALKYSDTILTMVNDKTNPMVLSSLHIDRAAALTGLKQFPPAITSLNIAMENAVLVKNLSLQKLVHRKLYETYKESGQTNLALENLEKYKTLSDSLVTKENAEAISEMEEKYNKKENLSTIRELGQQKRIYLLLALAGLLGVTAIAFFLRQQKLRHKKNILETEQRLNRARMNPHFFFNALASLQKFALKENDPQAMASNLSKFSNIMRETLESTYKEYVTIEQEMEFLNEYLEVQKIRFPQTFSYAVTAEKDLDIDVLQIPAMIIQPFVENSIEHGFAGVDYPGNVTVSFKKDEKDVLIQIMDNGKGLNTTVKENNEHISRASQIIRDRIYLLNIKLKTKAGFSIDNNPDGNGVIVKIHLPLLYKENNS
jgi:two-component sensor histidine kinase